MSLAALANQVVANINLNLQPFPTNKSTIDAKDFEWEQNVGSESMWSESPSAHPEIQKEIRTNTW